MNKTKKRSNEPKTENSGNYNRRGGIDIDKLAERWVELLIDEVLKKDSLLVGVGRKIADN